MTALDKLFPALNRTGALNGQPFNPAHPARPLGGRWGIAHYGVMVPNLPAPFRYLDAIVILGGPRVRIFNNRALANTAPRDTAWSLLGSAVTRDSLAQYSIADDCELTEDGGRIRLGSALTMIRKQNSLALEARHQDIAAALEIRFSSAVSHFAHLPGLYDHWSVLCEYQGSFSHGLATLEQSGLCTWEYARAVNIGLPFYFFTYHILNVDPDTQVLMVEVLGPRGLVIQRSVYVRDLSGTNTVHGAGFKHTVHEHAAEPLITPNGARMAMPKRFSWEIADITVEGTANDDWAYGLGAGYVGSYQYEGSFRDRPISGTAYCEWIDRR